MNKENKSHVISARFNDDEYLDVMMKITDESGTQLMKLSDFARASILSSKVVIVDSELEQYRAWVAASVGNNINQIARRLNTDAKTEILSESTYIDVLKELNKISVEMNKLLEPLK